MTQDITDSRWAPVASSQQNKWAWSRNRKGKMRRETKGASASRE